MASWATTQGPATTGLTHNEAAKTGDQLPEGEEEEVMLEGEELFMTLSPEERDSWQKMMQEREGSLKAGKEQFDRWRDSFNRRRMFADSRTRKLQESYRRRGTFYADLSVHLSAQNKGRRNSKPKLPKKGEDNGHNPSNNTPNRHQQPQQQQQKQQQQQRQLLQPQPQQTKEETATVKPLL